MMKFDLLQSRFLAVQQHQPATLDAVLLLTTEQIHPQWTDAQKYTALWQFSGWGVDVSQTRFYGLTRLSDYSRYFLSYWSK
ncbi:MAG: hypothetical protein E6Q25_06680 [Acinetobacter sp.]|nr:MAG: hypothetical protein E6Q25_06680 [Acinetobacter sp.]